MSTPFPDLNEDQDFYWSDYENNKQQKTEREVWNQGIKYLVKLAKGFDTGVLDISLSDHEGNWLTTDEETKLEAARRIILI